MNNLYLIVGDDSKLIDFYLNDILSKIDYTLDNKIEYDLSSDSITNILDEASMISLFSSVKVIIGNDFNITKMSSDDYEYLSKYIGNINKNVYIILLASKVDARSKYYKLFKDNFKIILANKTDSNIDINSYIKGIVKEKGYKFNDYDIEYFINFVGKDINSIKTELDKLFIYKDDKVITKEDIDRVCISNMDNVIYEFTNAVIENDIDNVKLLYDNFKKENVQVDYLITSLANVYRQLLIIKIMNSEGKSNSEIAKVIGKKEFYVKKMLERIYNYSVEDIGRFIINLAKVEIDYKSGKSTTDMLELLLIKNPSNI